MKSIADYNPESRQFISDLNSVISNLEEGQRIFATHAYCTDGGVAGSMLRYSFPDAKIIPVDYWYLNNPLAHDVLAGLDWYGIVDLKPFNKKPMQFWVDHHLGAMGESPNARQIRFDVDGDSGSYQLLLSRFTPNLPAHLTELAVMTRITDTANFRTPPPTETLDSIEELQLEPSLDDEKDRLLYERKVWLLDDVWNTISTYKDHQTFYSGAAKDGFYHLHKYIPKVNELRRERAKALEIANSLEVADCVIFASREFALDKTSLLRGLLLRPETKSVVALNVYEGGVKISLRRSKGLEEKWNGILQLNELAKLMSGGGHAAASGAHTNTVEEAVEIIKPWMEKRGLNVVFHDLTSY